MRITDIAVFLFCFLTMVGATSAYNFFGASMSANYTVLAIKPLEEIQSYNLPDAQSSGGWATVTYIQAAVIGAVNFVIMALNTLFKILSPALNLGGYLKQAIPFLPNEFCMGLTAIVNVVYILGIVQFMSGRSEKSMR